MVSLTEPLSFCMFDCYRKICKRRHSFTVAINKKIEALPTEHTFLKDEKMNLIIKFMSKQT